MVAPVDIPPWFAEQMARMSELRFPPSSLMMHWEGLQDMPLHVLRDAVTRAIPTRTHFPTPREIREDADIAGPKSTWQAEGDVFCELCQDTGWKPVTTDRGSEVVRCECYVGNPVIQRKRDATRKYAEARAK